jgi:hypothetical protein
MNLFEISSENEWGTFTKTLKSSKTWGDLERILKNPNFSISDKYFYISNLGSDSML